MFIADDTMPSHLHADRPCLYKTRLLACPLRGVNAVARQFQHRMAQPPSLPLLLCLGLCLLGLALTTTSDNEDGRDTWVVMVRFDNLLAVLIAPAGIVLNLLFSSP